MTNPLGHCLAEKPARAHAPLSSAVIRPVKPLDGTAKNSWHRAAEVPLTARTYYGWRTDIGTPGVTDHLEQIPTRQLSFSELMFTTRGGLHSLPQWIELYNPSYTAVVNLEEWHLEVEVPPRR